MAVWLIWIGVFFVLAVLVELARLSRILFRAMEGESKIGEWGLRSASGVRPRVSIMIPAKDEENHIEHSVRAILASEYPNFELILVDDRSRDTTPEIMRKLSREDSRISVVSVKELPEGWTGKTHALFRGAQQASGEIFLFIDADTWLNPMAVSCAVNYLVANNLDMLSLLPGFVDRGFRESAVFPHLALGFFYFFRLDQVNDEGHEAAMASGCFIMIHRSVYEDVGTWKRLKTEITEDVALGKVVKGAGHKLNVVRGDELVRTKSFESVADVCRFWKRTFYGSLEKSLPKILRLTANYAGLSLVSVVFLLSLGLLLSGMDSSAAVVLFIASGVTLAVIMTFICVFVKKTNQGPWLYGLTAPLGILIALRVALSTLFAVISGRGITWRGSSYR